VQRLVAVAQPDTTEPVRLVNDFHSVERVSQLMDEELDGA